VTRVAFQGELGAFSEQALRQIWGEQAMAVPQRTFSDVACAVIDAHVDCGVLPVHNAIVGPISASLAAIAEWPELQVIAETTVVIKPMLLALPGVLLENIKTIASHPAAIGQCGEFLRRHPGIQIHEAWDTAGAAKDLAISGDQQLAVIAGPAAAERYRLQVLVDAVADRADNLTRFVAIARPRER
jgi:prephenate dehydratase